MTTGIDRFTGKRLDGFVHVEQSLFYLFSLVIGSRIMRRNVGSAVPIILGRENVSSVPIARFWSMVILACQLWEPRFYVEQVIFPLPTDTPERLRRGKLGMRLIGEYRPNALLGDPTPARVGARRDFIL